MQFLRNRLLILALGFIVVACDSSVAQTLTTVTNNGNSSNRVDLMFIGDGYLASQLETDYAQDVNAIVDYFFSGNQAPFPRYSKFFNIHRVNIASNETGADRPNDNVYVDTALDSSYSWGGGVERCLFFNVGKANAAASTAVAGSNIDIDMRIGTINSPQYGGCGGFWATTSTNSSALEIALHEVGHSFAGLADEYWSGLNTYTGSEPNDPNLTTDPALGKWDRWVGYDDPSSTIGPIDYYEGGGYHPFGLYRPSLDSKMRSLSRAFDAISREEFINDIYREVNPLDDWHNNAGAVNSPSELWVRTIDPAVINVEWVVNGSSIGVMGETLDIGDLGLPTGNHLIEARAYDTILDHSFTGDSLDWWRLPNDSSLRQNIQWTISHLGCDSDGDGDCEQDDIDAMYAAFGSAGQFDYDADGVVTESDIAGWLSDASVPLNAYNTGNQTFVMGDVDLDGDVDSTDLGALLNNFMSTTSLDWGQGNLNGDGAINSTDLGLALNRFGFTSVTAVVAVPEPTAHMFFFTAGYLLLAMRRRNASLS